LKKAAWFFLEDSSSASEPFLLHNVDVISTIDFAGWCKLTKTIRRSRLSRCRSAKAAATLLFDEHLQLCGRRAQAIAKPKIVRPSPRLER